MTSEEAWSDCSPTLTVCCDIISSHAINSLAHATHVQAGAHTHAHSHMHTHTHTNMHVHARTHTHAHAHAHTFSHRASFIWLPVCRKVCHPISQLRQLIRKHKHKLPECFDLSRLSSRLLMHCTQTVRTGTQHCDLKWLIWTKFACESCCHPIGCDVEECSRENWVSSVRGSSYWGTMLKWFLGASLPSVSSLPWSLLS